MRILIVDDEKEFVDFMTQRLSLTGHEVDSAFDGDEALRLIKKNAYDVVFADHNMPELTGIELTRYMKDNGIASKVVMVTGYDGMTGTLAREVGVDAYLTKPVKIKDIDDIIAKYGKG